jgi:3-oxoacyl-[acyl-carrier-protein] synthase III
MGTYLKKIDYYLPEAVLSNKDLENIFPGLDSAKFEKKIGICQRHIAKENETSLDLAFQASQKLLKDYNKERIDFLILCTQSPDYFLPTTACILQNKLGLRTAIGAFDFNLGCSGFIYGLAIAKSLILSNLAESVLLITADTYSKFIHEKDRSNRIIFGDAAAATIIEKSDGDFIKEFSFGTDGRGYNNLIVKNGAARNRYDKNAQEVEYTTGNITTDNNLYMNGPAFFNFTIEAIPVVIEDVLRNNMTTIEEIDYCIFHQANKYMLDYLRTKMNIPKEKFYINMESTGNTVSSTIPIALKDCIDKKIIKSGDKVLLAGFGVGYSWGATIIEI